MKLALLPLDDRPVCYDLPASVAALAGRNVERPERALLGRFLEPGDTAALGAWLERVAPLVDAAVVSLDALAYGGLIASRLPQPDAAVATERVERLRALRRQYPALRLLAASVIMRNTTTATPELLPIRPLLTRLVALREVARRDPSALGELRELEARVPESVLRDFDAARARDHAINRLGVELVADGTLERLLLLQEDTAVEGPHRAEQVSLLAAAGAHGVLDRVHLYPGADEGGATLVARALTGDAAVPVEVLPTSRAGLEVVAPFEDRPLRDTLAGHMGALALSPADPADAVLVVHVPGASRAEIDAALALVGARLGAGRRVYLADVAVPNGADPRLLGPLVASGLYARLGAYAGWNTAGNTLGTLLAALRASEAAPGGSSADARERFLSERLIDDWVYQRALRGRLERRLGTAGGGPTVLLEGEALERARADLGGFGLRLANRLAARASVPGAASLELPWPRAFEVAVRLA